MKLAVEEAADGLVEAVEVVVAVVDSVEVEVVAEGVVVDVVGVVVEADEEAFRIHSLHFKDM